MRSSCLENLAADLPTASEKDVVVSLVDQGGCDCTIALNHLHHIGTEMVREQSVDQGGCCRRLLRRFHNSRVAGSQGADQGLQGEGERVIPGADDQHAAEGFANDFGSPGSQGQWHRSLARAHPLTQPPSAEPEFLAERQQLHHGFRGWLAEIVLQGLEDLLLMLIDQGLHYLELGAAPGFVPGLSPHDRIPQNVHIREGHRRRSCRERHGVGLGHV